MIYVTFKGTEYEIPYDRESLKINMAIDSTFDNGYFVSTPVEGGGTLDLSRRIPRSLHVRVAYGDDEFSFKTGETSMDKQLYGDTTKYVHTVNLVSLARDLTRKPLENITITQPQGDFGLYSRSVNNAELTVSSTTDPYTFTFTNTVNSNPSKVDELEIISLEEYRVSASFVFEYLPTITNLTLTIRIKYGATTVKTSTVSIPAYLGIKKITKYETITFNYTPAATGSFSVEIERDVAIGTLVDTKASLAITALTVISKPIRTYAQLVDKMLLRSEYVISPASRARLSLTAPEGKFEGYTIYDALSKIGGELGALVRVGGLVNEMYWKSAASGTEDESGDSLMDFSPYDYPVDTLVKIGGRYYTNKEADTQRREITFEFFDRPSVFDPIGEYDRSEQAELEDYVSAVELNTRNVIKPLRYSPFRDGWKGLRNIDGIGQATADNVGYETEDRIEKIISVKVKGLVSENATATITYSASDVTDITERVLEKRQYDTLFSESDYTYTGKQVLSKNNCLYFTQGDNKIYGMTHTGEHAKTLIGDPSIIRALYETILAVRSIESAELITRTGTQSADDPGLTGDLLIEMQITYANQTESRARIYKDDQSGFDTELIKYLNESANVNESESIGNFAQQVVNRLGGTKIIISGVVDSMEDVASLGDVDSSGRVYTLINIEPGERIKYTYTLVQDYNIISSYIGIQSRHRVEEISDEATTDRVLRYTSRFIFTDTQKTFVTRLINSHGLLGSLVSETSDGVTYGYMECNLSDGSQKKLHMSVDSDNKGRTIEIKWGLMNNYSAGLKRYAVDRSGTDIWLNMDVEYTDYYGKVNDILFALYYDSLNTYDKDEYPQASADNGDDVFVIVTDVIDKDAQEILHGLVEIPIMSESDKIRVYNGFARWNKAVEGTDRIRSCLLHYIPQKNANKVDLARVSDLAITAVATNGKLALTFNPSTTGVGVGYYNIDTLDLVLAYIDTIATGSQTKNLFYYMQDSRFGGGKNITTQASMSYVASDSLTAFIYEGVNYSEGVEYVTVLVEGHDAAIVLEYDYDTTGSYQGSQHAGTEYVEGTLATTGLTRGKDFSLPDTELDYDVAIVFQSQKHDGVNYIEGVNVQTVYTRGKDERKTYTLDYDTEIIMSGEQHIGAEHIETVNYDADMELGIDVNKTFTPTYELEEHLDDMQHEGVQYNEGVEYDTTLQQDVRFGHHTDLTYQASESLNAAQHEGVQHIGNVAYLTDLLTTKRLSQEFTLDYETSGSMTAAQHIGNDYSEGVEYVTVIHLGHDANKTIDINYEASESLTAAQHEGVNYNEGVEYVTGGSYTIPKWMPGGEEETVVTTCQDNDDEGNIREVITGCEWIEQDVYLSVNDQTDTSEQCSDTSTRIVCEPYSRDMFVCTLSDGSYIMGFETCTLVEEDL